MLSGMSRLKRPNTSVWASKLCGLPPGPASNVINTALNGLKLSPVTLAIVFSGWAGALAPRLGFGVVCGATFLKMFDAAITAAAGWKPVGVMGVRAGDGIAVAGGPLSHSTKCRLLL